MSKKRTWSLSTISLYEQCPRKYKAIKIDKITEPPSYFLTRGIKAHEALENYLLGNIPVVPTVGVKFWHELKELKAQGAIAEEMLTFDKDWNIIEDGWMHDDAWLRMKIDARVGNILIDFKTGKHYPEHVQQAELYAISHMRRFPEVDEVTVEFWYLYTGDITTYSFKRDDVEHAMQKWRGRVVTLESDESFNPRKNKYCKYCHVKKDCPI